MLRVSLLRSVFPHRSSPQCPIPFYNSAAFQPSNSPLNLPFPLTCLGARSRGGGGDDAGLRVKQAVDDHLHIVSELLADVHGKVRFLYRHFCSLCMCLSH